MATLCHISGRPLHPFGFQPLPCLCLRASHGYRSDVLVWLPSIPPQQHRNSHDPSRSRHESPCTQDVHVNHLCSFQILDIRPIHPHLVSRLQQVYRRHLADWGSAGAAVSLEVPNCRKNSQKLSSHSSQLAPSVLWHKEHRSCSRHETGTEQLPRQARRSTRCVCTDILHTPAA